MKKGIGLGLATRLNQDFILDRFERTQEGFSTITERVRESLSGIREIRASEAWVLPWLFYQSKGFLSN